MVLPINMTGQRFGRLTILGEDPVRHNGKLCWLCKCDCGEMMSANGTLLRNGTVKSCGCLRREMGVERGKTSRKHGEGANQRETPEYRAWTNMKSRCQNPNHVQFPDYGGRGIRVCERWQTFENFLADVGRRPSKFHSIDRINNDGGYEPGNVRWATWEEQNSNQRKRGEGSKARAAR